MAWEKAETILLSEKQRKVLEVYEKGTPVPLNLKKRATIFLEAASGKSNHRISKEQKINRESVIRWRSPYLSAAESLLKAEFEGPKPLKHAITKVLSDEPRPGAKTTFTYAQRAAIIAKRRPWGLWIYLETLLTKKINVL